MKYLFLSCVVLLVIKENVAIDRDTAKTLNNLIKSLHLQQEGVKTTIKALRKIAMDYQDKQERAQIYKEILRFMLRKYMGSTEGPKPTSPPEENAGNQPQFSYFKVESDVASPLRLIDKLKKLLQSKEEKENRFKENHASSIGESVEKSASDGENKEKNSEKKSKKRKKQLEKLDDVYSRLEKIALAAEKNIQTTSNDSDNMKSEPK